MANIVYVVSTMTQHGRVERVLTTLRAAGYDARHLAPSRRGHVHWPKLTQGDCLVVHFGTLAHNTCDQAMREARATGARFLMIRSLNLDTIFTFVRGGHRTR